MKPIPSVDDLAVRTSRHRFRVLLTLASLGEAYAGQLSRATGIRWDRVKAALVGGRDYRADRSLVGLGFAEELRLDHGTVYRITNRGLRKARSITSSRVRKAASMPRRDVLADPLVFPPPLERAVDESGATERHRG